ncbi:hypothetical protein CSKR_107141 [Clonorchis sinensis]|uniref:EF-hand domain-containing protein n=1 Tax=Clonorchis sinensis TaxID=79923 RepID=A0A8T1M2B4_CLOSI|nr:hypothetical protein CSKR_107141 [Clonorchis sinensis]
MSRPAIVQMFAEISGPDGRISLEELQIYLRQNDVTINKELLEAYIEAHDYDSDGKLSLEELLEAFKDE